MGHKKEEILAFWAFKRNRRTRAPS